MEILICLTDKNEYTVLAIFRVYEIINISAQCSFLKIQKAHPFTKILRIKYLHSKYVNNNFEF